MEPEFLPRLRGIAHRGDITVVGYLVNGVISTHFLISDDVASLIGMEHGNRVMVSRVFNGNLVKVKVASSSQAVKFGYRLSGDKASGYRFTRGRFLVAPTAPTECEVVSLSEGGEVTFRLPQHVLANVGKDNF